MKTHPDCKAAGRTACRMLCASWVAILPATALAQWPGWGGPDRNFTSSAKGLASTWPKDGGPPIQHRHSRQNSRSVLKSGRDSVECPHRKIEMGSVGGRIGAAR